MEQLRNTDRLHTDLLCVSVPINKTIHGKCVLKCVLVLVFASEGKGRADQLYLSLVSGLGQADLYSHLTQVCVQADIQNYKKYVNLYVNISTLGTWTSRLLPNWKQRLGCYKV